MLFSHVKLVKKPRLNWKSIDCNCEQYINVGNPFLPIAIFSTLACVIALCSIPHSKSDWYSLIPANYCHFVRVHVAAAGSFFLIRHTINSTQILCTDDVIFRRIQCFFFFCFPTCGIFTQSSCCTAMLFNYLIYLTCKKAGNGKTSEKMYSDNIEHNWKWSLDEVAYILCSV